MLLNFAVASVDKDPAGIIQRGFINKFESIFSGRLRDGGTYAERRTNIGRETDGHMTRDGWTCGERRMDIRRETDGHKARHGEMA